MASVSSFRVTSEKEPRVACVVKDEYNGLVLGSALALLIAQSSAFSPVGGVEVSCLENLRGKVGRAKVEIVVGAGALDEGENERGVAHLLEHLLLRPINFDDSNATTSWDHTSFYRDVTGGELQT